MSPLSTRSGLIFLGPGLGSGTTPHPLSPCITGRNLSGRVGNLFLKRREIDRFKYRDFTNIAWQLLNPFLVQKSEHSNKGILSGVIPTLCLIGVCPEPNNFYVEHFHPPRPIILPSSDWQLSNAPSDPPGVMLRGWCQDISHSGVLHFPPSSLIPVSLCHPKLFVLTLYWDIVILSTSIKLYSFPCSWRTASILTLTLLVSTSGIKK